MKKVPKEKGVGEGITEVVQLGLPAVVRQGLREMIFEAGVSRLLELLEEERTAICGPRYAHDPGRTARRSGHVDGELVLGGRLIGVRRPRARSVDGRELALPSWVQFRDRDPLDARAVEQMIVGVSTRKYDRSLESIAPQIKSRGTSKSAVSRRFVATTEASVRSWLQRDLSAIDLVVLMVDGLCVEDHVLLVALGIDVDGKKHVLGVREGATENAVACTALLSDLQSRGLRTTHSILGVIDGSKALAKAIRSVFGRRVQLQRCQAHKVRNVEAQVPDSMRASVRQAMRQAYRCGTPERAERLLRNLLRRLSADHPGAAASLEEGLTETITVMQFGLPEWLERTLATTNAIENLIGSTRDISRRVKRWRDGKMIVRWTATALIEAEKHFRRVRGHSGLRLLAAALRCADVDDAADAVATTAQVA